MTPDQISFMTSYPYKPRVCVWELTLSCNLRCGHCGSRAGIPRDNELSTEQCLEVVNDLADMGCELITLSGGEPTMHPGWATIAREIRRRGMIPNMVTNGVNCTEEMAAEFVACGLSNVAVSVDGTESIHEQIRGKNPWDKPMTAIRNIQKAGLPVTIMTTINQLNLPHLEAIYDICVNLGVSRWRLQLGKPMGNLEDHEDWVIRPEEILYVLPRLHRLADRGPVTVGIGDSIGFHSVYDIPLRSTSWRGKKQVWAGCQAGMQAIGIESDGGVKGCLSMQDGLCGPSTFTEGNLLDRSLFDIWTDPNSFAYNRKFKVEDLTGACSTCAHGNTCRGGAHCVSIAVNGLTTENTYCYYMQAQRARTKTLGKLKYSVATAAALVMAGLTSNGCFIVSEPDYGVEPNCDAYDCGDPNLPSDIREECCSNLDYGVEPNCYDYSCSDLSIPENLYYECCDSMDYGVEPPICENVDCNDPDTQQWISDICCASLEYGVEPTCDNVNCSDPDLDPVIYNDCCTNMDYGVEPICDIVDCADPDLDPDLYNECCAAPEYGVDPCEGFCCDCDYGASPDLYELCCTKDDPSDKKDE
ncbi:radical SAM protein [Myxococcota bacterium]|nr:radical SAM protein [Myxococcota bacterium]